MHSRHTSFHAGALVALFAGILLATPVLSQSLTITRSTSGYEATMDRHGRQAIPLDVVGDLNHDGDPELLVGDRAGIPGSFGRYLIFGRSESSFTIPDLSSMTRAEGIQLGWPLPMNHGNAGAPSGSASRMSFRTTSAAQPMANAVSLVSDFNQLPAGIQPYMQVMWNGKLYFSGFDPDHGSELYRLDGSTPVRITDILAGPSSSDPSFLTPFGNKLVFSAFEPSTGRELYAYDGNTTTRLTDIDAGPESSILDWSFQIFGGQFVQADNKLYFTATDGKDTFLYAYDGTTAAPVNNPNGGTPIKNATGLMVYKDMLLFFQFDQQTSNETFYSYDNGVLTPITTIQKGYNFGFLFGNTIYKDNLVFVGVENFEQVLFSFNGTTLTKIATEADGETLTDPMYPTVVGDKLYFTAWTEPTGTEIFSYDGTAAHLALNIVPGEEDADVYFLTSFGNRLYFFRNLNTTSFYDLYVSDGTTVSRWADVDQTAFYPLALFPIGNTLYTTAYSVDHGMQIWTLNGNTSARVTGQSAATVGSSPHALTSIGNDLYFGAARNMTEGGLYRFDGSSVNLVANLGQTALDDEILQIEEFNGKVYFIVQEGDQDTRLYSNDGTSPKLIRDNTHDYMAVYNGKLYFGAVEPQSQDYRLYQYDGQTVSLAPDAMSVPPTDPILLTVFNGKLYFGAIHPTTGYELFSYDGTTSAVAADITTGPGSGGPQALAVFKNKLYFVSGVSIAGQLYQFDGSNASPINGASVICGLDQYCIVPGGDYLYYRYMTNDNKRELFRFDGTNSTQVTSGTGVRGYDPVYITYLGGKVYFSGLDEAKGRELFVFDGTTNTNLVADIYPGYDDSSPVYLVAHKDKVYFAATGPAVSQELYQLDPGGSTDAEDQGPVVAVVLSQNYPNPASRETIMSFTLPRPAQVQLALYDVLGRRVAVLADGAFGAGKQTIVCPVQALPAGTYFYRIEADGQVITRSMNVIR